MRTVKNQMTEKEMRPDGRGLALGPRHSQGPPPHPCHPSKNIIFTSDRDCNEA